MVKAMEDELLADILAAERAIRLEIEGEERLSEERLAKLGQELERRLADEAETQQAALEQALAASGQQAEEEAAVLLEEARTYARRLENLDDVELDRVLVRHLMPILNIHPDDSDDR